jgi:filamin
MRSSVDPYGQMNQQYQNGYNQQQIPQNGYPNQQNGQPQYQPQYQQYLDDYDDQEFDKTEEEIDEEMQRELAEDAPWKKIQQNTFTRWANEHLKLVNRRIEDLQLDFSDGLSIIALVEVLSHKKLPRHNRKPMFRSQKLENVSVALDFLENVERIRLVNIDSSHLVDGKLKLILGLIWTLILHYSITMPQWENENPDKDNKGKKATPKQKLMDWVKSRMPDDVPINNFTTDWNDGRAIGALVDSCAPGKRRYSPRPVFQCQ